MTTAPLVGRAGDEGEAEDEVVPFIVPFFPPGAVVPFMPGVVAFMGATEVPLLSYNPQVAFSTARGQELSVHIDCSWGP